MTSNNEKQPKYTGEKLIKEGKINKKKRKKMKKKRCRPVNGDALENSTANQILNTFSKDEEKIEGENGTSAIIHSQYIDKLQKTEIGILKPPPFRSNEKAPWLAFFSYGKGGKTHTICSMGDHKIYVRSIPQVARKKCGACPLGWIFVEDWDTKHVNLLNPVSMESIDLTPIPQLPKLHPLIDSYRRDWSFQMTALPTEKNSIIILYYSYFPYIIFCYPSEKVWYVKRCMIRQNSGCQEKGGILRKHRLREDDDPVVSIAVVDGNIYGYTLAGRYTKLIFNHSNFTIKCLDLMPENELYCGTRFSRLVHSSGNLYKVDFFSEGFFVFKMNFIEMRWEETGNIGENKAFLYNMNGDGVYSCHADEASLQKNCIYYIDCYNYLHQYKLEDRSTTMLSYFPRLRLPENVSPLWVVPQSKDLTILDDINVNVDISQKLEEHIGSEKNPVDDYKMSTIENDFTTPSKQPIIKIRESVIAARRMSEGAEEGEKWLSLLPELVLDIMKYLSYLDSRCAILAIPQWAPALCTVAKPIGSWYQDSPCLLSFPENRISRFCTLMDPVRGVRHLIQFPDLPSNVIIVSAKHGWLLLRGPTCADVFFYNPLSKAVINLPRPSEIFPAHLEFSFSTLPTSPDCVVVAYHLHPSSRRILICSRGENSWTQILHEWGELAVLMVRISCAVFRKQKFHFLSVNGMLGVLDPTTRSWGIVRTYKFEKFCENYRYYLVESDNELFMVQVGMTGESVRVDRLDYSSFTWNEVTSLERRCFFLSHKASISMNASVFDDKEERIYFPMFHDDRMVYYSYHTKELRPTESFYGAKEFLLSWWIQPSWVQPTIEELQWF